ncbi:hypothetical protein [Oryzihumus sp.]
MTRSVSTPAPRPSSAPPHADSPARRAHAPAAPSARPAQPAPLWRRVADAVVAGHQAAVPF